MKRAEEAEAQLKPVADELAGLKQHITHMTAAIFGKTHMHFNICFDITLNRLATLNSCYLTHLTTYVQAPEAPALAKIC